ncbi:white collar 2 type of transcription factor [Leucoagaricus gongylophorus]
MSCGQSLPSMNSIYATSSLQHAQYSSLLDDALKNAPTTSYDSSLINANYNGETLRPSSDDHEDSARKKKLKKTHGIEQYVCRKCGRTDSPEWRKGPDGPKTLCNACGLRWAKQMRKFDEPTEETGSNSSQPSSTPGTDKVV